MYRSHHTHWLPLALLVAGAISMSAACAQPGWRSDPGSGWGPGPHNGGYGAGPGMMGPGMMGPGMGPGMMRPGMGRNMPGFGAFDRNDDGRVSEEELQQTRAERLRQRSQQGYPMRGAGFAPSFSDLDTDGSGGISPAEFARFHGAARRP